MAIVNVLATRLDPKPAQNTWTYILRAFKKQLLLLALDRIGVDALFGARNLDEVIGEIDKELDAECTDEYTRSLNGARLKKLREHFSVNKTFEELAWSNGY